MKVHKSTTVEVGGGTVDEIIAALSKIPNMSMPKGKAKATSIGPVFSDIDPWQLLDSRIPWVPKYDITFEWDDEE